MAYHVICPSLRCRKVLTLNDEARGTLVTCRYCNMQFRVPQLRRASEAVPPKHIRGESVGGSLKAK